PERLRVDVVALEVEVHAALVVDVLHLDIDVPLRPVEARVALAVAAHARHAERIAPEARGHLRVGVLAVDDEPHEPAPVHWATVSRQPGGNAAISQCIAVLSQYIEASSQCIAVVYERIAVDSQCI